MSKDVQDALRRIHRGLRSSFATSAGEIARSVTEAVRAAEHARVSPADPIALDAELASLQQLTTRLEAARG